MNRISTDRRLVRVSCTVFALLLTHCSGGSSPAPPATASPVAPSPAPSSTGATLAGAAKQPLHGLVSMGSDAFTSSATGVPDNGMEEIDVHPGVYSGAVINATWAQLEPAQGTFDDDAIDSALATIAAYNAEYPATPVVAKLRVFAGVHVPTWLFAVAGGPVTITTSDGTEQIAAFWSAGYDAAWRALQAHLAATYDKSSAIGEVAVSSCSSLTAEPFVAALDATTLAAARPFGFSDATYMACLNGAVADYAAWTQTPLDFTFNTYRLSDGPTLVSDPSFTIAVMQNFRATIGSRGVTANHGLQDPLSTGAQPIYAELTTLGPPIEFQTVSPTVDWPTTFAYGLTFGPTEVEIWQTIAAGGQAALSQSQLQTFASDLPVATTTADHRRSISNTR